MKKKLLSVLLALCICIVPAALVACDEEPGGSTVEQKPYTVVEIPVLSYDTSADKVTDDSIATDTFAIAYDEGEEAAVEITSGNVTASAPQTSTADGVTTASYTFTASGVGRYTVAVTVGEETDEITYTVAPAYPGRTMFGGFTNFGTNNTSTTTANVHDPCIIEADGTYYVFSTDNYDLYGYTIRQSTDLIGWSWGGVAIPGFNVNGAPPTAATMNESNALWEVYEYMLDMTRWNGSCWTLWAPEVVPAADGGYWLYGSWTSAFGSPQSIIFLCHADEVTGPYELVHTSNGEPAIIVNSYDGGGSWPNAIDASVYYDTEGNMYMCYGSDSGGIFVIELDPATGLRKDGYTASQLASGSTLTQSQRYGQRIAQNGGNTEGPVISYHEDVEISSYDGTGTYNAAESTYQDRYYLMTSWNSLSSTYNMRGSYSTTPTGTYNGTASGTATATRISGAFSWRTSANDTAISFDFYVPGHNDMIQTSQGRNLLAYHNRITFGGNNHFLFVSSYAFNSRGDLVMNPNRYAGEAVRKITEEEIYTLSDTYSFTAVTGTTRTGSFNQGYAMEGLELRQGNTVYFNNVQVGTWELYGNNYVLISLTSEISGTYGNNPLSAGNYYGVAFPAFIEKEARGGISISCVSENGNSTLYLNMMDIGE